MIMLSFNVSGDNEKVPLILHLTTALTKTSVSLSLRSKDTNLFRGGIIYYKYGPAICSNI